MLTPMAIDPVRHHEIKQAAEKLLQERYGKPDGPGVTGQQALEAVLRAVNGFAPFGEQPREVPAEEVLAALTQVAEARERLDRMELRLIEAARERGASWQKVADSLGLEKRQSAEGRALRLQGAVKSYRSNGRDVGSQRLEKARQRAADAWCESQADRIRDVAERLIDTSEAWGDAVAGDVLTRSYFQMLGARLASDGDAKDLFDTMESLRISLVPYGRPEPQPTGKHAAAAAKARDDLAALHAEVSTARYAVTSARDGGKP
uniref:Uncharacterized protein n=1 Tax=Streptomyces sp. FQ1 TaxID=319426 RepID=Q58IN2_9ACTN|nr:hypothetical protein [Streptomyces sp. FQ1]AAX51351.1 unknown [Streptomyces sp. FQ1]